MFAFQDNQVYIYNALRRLWRVEFTNTVRSRRSRFPRHVYGIHIWFDLYLFNISTLAQVTFELRFENNVPAISTDLDIEHNQNVILSDIYTTLGSSNKKKKIKLCIRKWRPNLKKKIELKIWWKCGITSAPCEISEK